MQQPRLGKGRIQAGQYAIPDSTYASIGQVPAKIVIGDGVLQGFDGLGYADIAPLAILAHEFGHHIQHDPGILYKGINLIPKTSRCIKLMGDAYATYLLSHAKGAAIEGKRMQQFLDVFSNLGDCNFF
jgi:hypothetical protein